MPDVEWGDTPLDSPDPYFDLTDGDTVVGEWPAISRVRYALAACESCGRTEILHRAPVVYVDGGNDYIKWDGIGSMSLNRWRALVASCYRVSPGPCKKCGWEGLRAAGITGGSDE